MTASPSTCWTQIKRAAAGDQEARAAFVWRYQPVLRAYLKARWRGAQRTDLEDAVQEIYLACLQPNGVLKQADQQRTGGFRAFLYGVARNVARQFERSRRQVAERQASASALLAQAADDPTLSQVFDRAFARAIMQQAAARQHELAAAAGAGALRRVELLRLRFAEGMPIRAIATLWGTDAARLHHEYARAREEFRSALLAVVQYHHPGEPEAARREAENLIELLGDR